ncbi:hypothetical protein C4577_04145 [Candidatus Parcubacteria bacterium]|nr:MAG: hypothetical protein C4577_04145 [Candidatus Parcubacteria bacterium]
MKFFPAPDVKEIADELIPKNHRHLVGVRMDFLFSETTPKRGGKDVWGTMRKVSSLAAYLGADKTDQERGVNDPFFVMTISQPIWDELEEKDRIALVDHELCHAAVELDDQGDSILGTKSHDVEEFSEIIERHGLWRKSVQEFVEAAVKNKESKKKAKEENGTAEKQDN